MKNIELDELDPSPYVSCRLVFLLILCRTLTLKNLSRERIKRLNDFKTRHDRVGLFLKDVHSVL